MCLMALAGEGCNVSNVFVLPASGGTTAFCCTTAAEDIAGDNGFNLTVSTATSVGLCWGVHEFPGLEAKWSDAAP